MFEFAFLVLVIVALYVLVYYCSTVLQSTDFSVIALTLLLAALLLFSKVLFREQFQDEAVKVGHAKYIINKQNDKEFKWLATQTAELKERKK